jgi:hypothetical protein
MDLGGRPLLPQQVPMLALAVVKVFAVLPDSVVIVLSCKLPSALCVCVGVCVCVCVVSVCTCMCICMRVCLFWLSLCLCFQSVFC